MAVETRAIPGRDVKQVNAQGLVDAPPHVVRAVLVDLERYPGFMPYVKESRVLSRDASGDALNYQRLSFGMPFVQDRHYVIRVAEREYRDAEGRAWAIVWRLEDGLPSDAIAGAVRVSVNSGYWDVRPAAGARARPISATASSPIPPAHCRNGWLVWRTPRESPSCSRQ